MKASLFWIADRTSVDLDGKNLLECVRKVVWAFRSLRFVRLTAFCTSLLLAHESHAQFTNIPTPEIPGVVLGSPVWGDYDNDGRLDLLLEGASASDWISQLWRNTGNGFTNVPIVSLPGVVSGSAAWADYDNDGRLDFLLTGQDSSFNQISQLWRNTGNGFTNVPILGLPGVGSGSVAWADYDNDGRRDFLITGGANSLAQRISQLWRNTGKGFTNVTIAGLPGVESGSIAWGDYDNDGWLDFLIIGRDGWNKQRCDLWRNTGNGFTNAPIAGLPGVESGSVAWGDYDNDGRLDFFVTGNTNLSNSEATISQLWRNTGAGFTNVPIPGLAGVNFSTVAWGDYDNDGWLDFLITGWTGSNRISQVWRNTGSGFTKTTIAGLAGVSSGSVAWADYDNDGRLDFLVTGGSDSGLVFQIWRNVGSVANGPPPAPSGLTSAVSNGIVTMSWSSPMDNQSGTNLTYNLRIGSSPGGSDIFGPQSDLASGFRRVPLLGHAQLGTCADIYLVPGVYYWSVQAVDGAFAGGPFGMEESFSIAAPKLTISSTAATVTISWSPNFPGSVLQENWNLSTEAWSNAPSGGTNPVSFPPLSPMKYYRVSTP